MTSPPSAFVPVETEVATEGVGSREVEEEVVVKEDVEECEEGGVEGEVERGIVGLEVVVEVVAAGVDEGVVVLDVTLGVLEGG